VETIYVQATIASICDRSTNVGFKPTIYICKLCDGAQSLSI